MASYNSVTLIGNLTRDPELRYTKSGAAVAAFSIALNEVWMQNDQKQERVSYIDCQAWAKTAETVAHYFNKGNPIMVDGNLRQERWETEDGHKRSKVIVNVSRVHFLPRNEARDTSNTASLPSPPVEPGNEADPVPF
mgnify:CR=1 FL=1